MKNWLKLALVALTAFAVAELALHRARSPSLARAVAAPPLTLRDTGGREVSLAALHGRVVAVNFWATWCGPCLQEIPDFVRVYSARRDKCFEMLGVAEESGTRDDVMTAARRLGVNYPVLIDDDGRAGEAFSVPAYPRTFLIDVEGRIRAVFEGSVRRDAFERALAPLLAEAPASCPRA